MSRVRPIMENGCAGRRRQRHPVQGERRAAGSRLCRPAARHADRRYGRHDHQRTRKRSNRPAGVSTDGTPSRAFSSDAAGNVVEDTDLSSSTTKEFAYNHPGQLSGVEVASTPVGSYEYDYLSRLVVRGLPAASATLHLVHDLDGNLMRKILDWRSKVLTVPPKPTAEKKGVS